MDYPLYPQLTNGQNDQYLQYQDPLQEDSFGQLSDTNLESKTSYEIPYLSTQPLRKSRSKEQMISISDQPRHQASQGLQDTNSLLTSVNEQPGMRIGLCYQLNLKLLKSRCF